MPVVSREGKRSVPGCCLCDGCNRSDRGGGDAVDIDIGLNLSVGVLLGAVPRDVASFTTLVASLAGRVQGATVRSSAVARDVAQLATSVALHGLGLAVSGKMVGATALVAGSRTGATKAAASIATGIATTAHRSSTAHRTDRVRARALHESGQITKSTSGGKSQRTAK